MSVWGGLDRNFLLVFSFVHIMLYSFYPPLVAV